MNSANSFIEIQGRRIGLGQPAYLIAEMSANHNQSFDHAERILRAAHAAGADAVKIQTYTPDTLTIDCNKDPFQIHGGLWDGQTLYQLYKEAYTPWEWQPRLKKVADELGIALFSSPFDDSAVDFLEEMGVPAYKIASFELVDLGLLRRVASTRKPVILSTGLATLGEIEEAVATLREAGSEQIALLKCTSSYPAPPEEINLKTIPHLAETFDVPIGLSDHTLGITVPCAAVALGACIIEKHFTLSRRDKGPDSAFSLEPHELSDLARSVRLVQASIGAVNYGPTQSERSNTHFRRSLFVVEDVRSGETFTSANVRSIRPGGGLAPRFLSSILGKHSARDIPRGTPFSWDLIGTGSSNPLRKRGSKT